MYLPSVPTFSPVSLLRNKSKLMRSTCCLCVWICMHLSTLELPNQSLWNFVCISWHRCVCMCSPSIVATQRFSRYVIVPKNTRSSARIVGRIVLYAGLVSKESLWLCVPLLSLLGNGSLNTFPQKRRIVGRVVFYVVHVISKESGRLVLPRTSC
jgi:hypothetical protein